MKTNLPTTPGPYWWREKDGDEWIFISVTAIVGDLYAESLFIPKEMKSYLDRWGDYYPVGQWSKAHNPDEGVEAWATVSADGNWVTIGESRTEALREFCCRGNRNFSENDVERMWEKYAKEGYTCAPVTIYRKDQKV